MNKIITVLVLIIFTSTSVMAHSGRTNSSGCHNKTSNKSYHCHNGSLDGLSSEELATIGIVIIVVGGVIYISKKMYDKLKLKKQKTGKGILKRTKNKIVDGTKKVFDILNPFN